MQDYRIYLINDFGRIQSGSDFSCSSDDEARDRARSLLGHFGRAEVWTGTRKVAIEVINAGGVAA